MKKVAVANQKACLPAAGCSFIYQAYHGQFSATLLHSYRPASYTSSVIELTMGDYYMSGKFDFLDQKGNSIKQFYLYTLSHSEGNPSVMLYDATEKQWYSFTYPAFRSIDQFIETAGKNGFLTTISDTNP